jgi:hypothetical protein
MKTDQTPTTWANCELLDDHRQMTTLMHFRWMQILIAGFPMEPHASFREKFPLSKIYALPQGIARQQCRGVPLA